MPDVDIIGGDIGPLVDAVRGIAGEPISELNCLTEFYDVCLSGLITDFSRFIWNQYNAANRNQNETFESSQKLPAAYIEACNIIEDELKKWSQSTNIE